MIDNQENIEILKSVELDYGIAQLRADNILTFEPNSKFKIYSVPELKEMLEVFKGMTGGIPRPYYCDNRNINANLKNDAKTYITAHFHEFATVFAMAENSAITRFVAHTVMYIYKPKVPLKMFKNKRDAIEWLKEN